MTDQRPAPEPEQSTRSWETRRRWVGNGAFLAAFVAGIAFFGFFPGLPHVIDWGAVVMSLVVGGLARWMCRSRMAKARGEELERRR
ncbi:hypothetical protein ACIBL8_33300 [Streptomyces sp. NPDC050523]|uniref:hypothetical protein n=1 Tax=Streptomyces sp. NPDC050523 TaxID=3365622 RepID=UPI003797B3A4